MFNISLMPTSSPADPSVVCVVAVLIIIIILAWCEPAPYIETLILWVLFKLNTFLKNLNSLHKCCWNHNGTMDVLKVSVIPTDKPFYLVTHHIRKKTKIFWIIPVCCIMIQKTEMIHKVYFSKNCHRHTKYLNQHNFKAFLTWLVFVGTKCQS